MKLIKATDAGAQPLSISQRIDDSMTPVLYSPDLKAAKRFWEFFMGVSKNHNTRMAYKRATYRFADWCEQYALELSDIEPVHIEAYTQQMEATHAPASIKQHMSALKKLFDFFITGQIVTFNPVDAVARPVERITRGKTDILEPTQMKHLFKSIKLNNVVDYRDRAVIAIMAYSFARVSAVCAMNRESYRTSGTRSKFILTEKGGRINEVPAHHTAQEFVDAYIDNSACEFTNTSALFRTIDPKTKALTETRLSRGTVWSMVKRRCANAGLPYYITNHSFRGTGITTYMLNGGNLEAAADIAGHANPSTTKLYDRSGDKATLDEIERILY